MSPSLTHLALPDESEETFVHLISDLLSPGECAALIQGHDLSLISTAASFTNRLRGIFVDADLAEMLWNRLEQFYGDAKIVDEDGCGWAASGLNTHFRICRYEAGGIFAPHFDGRRLASINSQSFMAVNIYLNTVPPEDGGATRILSPSVTGSGHEKHQVLGKVHPVEGSASVFRDSLFHDGEELRAGVKYLLRTDVLFDRDSGFDINTIFVNLSDEEKGKRALGFATKLEDGGSPDEAIGWYKKAYRLCPALERPGS